MITLDSCKAIAVSSFLKIINDGKLKKGGGIWSIENEIKPADLYLYLYAKFGAPNGPQNLFRKDDSDNLIHWDWVLTCDNGIIMIMGLNLRTEIHFLGNWDLSKCDKNQFIFSIKKDLSNYGKKMSQIRKEKLEDWDVFVNPFHQIKKAVEQLKEDIDALDLNPEDEKIQNPTRPEDFKKFSDEMSEMMTKYNRAIGLSMALKIMTPILAESFINLIIFVLCRQEIKQNPRLFDNFVRSNIDVRVQSLQINCIGFKDPVNWKDEACKSYNTIVNGRNDLLHGNIALNKLKFSDIFFNGSVPVFKKYESIWQQSIGVSMDASGLSEINEELQVVDQFIEYIYSCMDPIIKEQVQQMADRRDLGLNRENARLGVLLPEYLVDFGVSYE